MVSWRCGDPLFGQLIGVLADAPAPLTTGELRGAMATTFNVYVINGALEAALVELENRGKVTWLDGRWQLRADAIGAAVAGVVPEIGAGDGDCVKILDERGNLLYMNSEGCRALGVSPSSEFGMSWLELLPVDFRRQGLRALNAAMGGARSRFTGITGGDAHLRRWSNVLTPLEGVDGSIRHVVCVSQDVTDQAQRMGK